MSRADTIAAVATASGRGGVAVVRLSGSEAYAIARTLVPRLPAPGSFAFARFRNQEGELLDEGLVLVFKAPASYTGEDVVEFQGHGGAVAPRRVLNALLASGARLARRGEFTERAFLNGRLGLEAAESVLALVDAKTDRAAEAALAGLGETRLKAVRILYDRLLDLSATLEHALDIDEGELPEDFQSEILRRAADLSEETKAVRRQLEEGRLLRTGACVVLAGEPNAGKSSLMNALLEEQRVIVSATPGTTRDAVEAWLDVAGWPVRLIDTAGIREADDPIEAAGVKRAREWLRRADVILAFDDAAGTLEGENVGEVIRLHAKCDLGRARGVLNVSSRTGEGLSELRQTLAAALSRRAESADFSSESFAPVEATVREALIVCAARLAEVGDDLVLAGNAIRSAADRLGEVLGLTYREDLLTRLFSRFCVGK